MAVISGLQSRSLALTAHKAAGDAADGVELFVEVDGQREVIHAVFRAGGGRAGDEHGRLAVADEDGGVAQLCEFAGLHHEGTAFILDLVALVVGELLVRGDDHGFWCSFLLLAETPEPALASASHARWGADSNTGQRRSRKWAAGAETKKAGGQYEIIPLRSNVHTLRKSRTYLRMFSFAMIAR